MKFLLVGINAKYIHSNPAIYSLAACAGEGRADTETAEYTINHQVEQVVADIFRRQPDVIGFSCYIWNMSFIRAVVERLHWLMPQVPMWFGGPEVSFETEAFLMECPEAFGVMVGEGERTYARVLEQYRTQNTSEEALAQIPGLVFRRTDGTFCATGQPELPELSDIPFLYSDLSGFENRILYYETSRGCPFRCSYCLSSADSPVRLRSLDLVLPELQFFLDQKVSQVKFVDRTFNCNHRHCQTIWRYLQEHDNGVTNFHFEISADLLNETEMEILSQFRPGQIQLEIGIQTTNDDALMTIHRTAPYEKIAERTERIRKERRIHQHLDLIAGLPYEDYDSFGRSYDAVYALRPDQLQLGFLKLLKGSELYRRAEEYGLVYSHIPPYEILSTPELPFERLLALKEIEEVTELYYNSGQFRQTLEELMRDARPFVRMEHLAVYFHEKDLFEKQHNRLAKYTILWDFLQQEITDGERLQTLRHLLTIDWYQRELTKVRPVFADPAGIPEKEEKRRFYQREAKQHRWLAVGYDEEDSRLLANVTHLEKLDAENALLFDYRNRDFFYGNAKILRVRLSGE